MSIRQEDRFGYRGYSNGTTWLPSVSSILDILAPMPKGWIDQEALEEGVTLHRALFLMSKKQSVNLPTREHTVFPRGDAAVFWLASEGFTVVESELHRISPYGYGGTPDALLYRAKKYYVPDFKFSESLTKRYEVQLELYRRLDFGKIPRPEPLLIQIAKDGKVRPKYLRPHAAHFAAAMNALNVIRWRLAHGK